MEGPGSAKKIIIPRGRGNSFEQLYGRPRECHNKIIYPEEEETPSNIYMEGPGSATIK